MARTLGDRSPLIKAATLTLLALVALNASAADFTPFSSESLLLGDHSPVLEDGCMVELDCSWPYVAPPTTIMCYGLTSCSVGTGYIVCDGQYYYCNCPTVRCASWYTCWKRYGDMAYCADGCCVVEPL